MHIVAELLNAQLLHKEGNLQQAIEVLQSESNVDIAEWWYELGVLYWKLKKYDKSLLPFLKVRYILIVYTFTKAGSMAE